MSNSVKWLIGIVAVVALGAIIYYLAQLEASDISSEIPGRGESEVQLVNNQFVPNELTVQAGEQVVWINYDRIDHTVTSDDGMFDERLLADESFSYTFEQAGTYEYDCTIHPVMQGRIVVE